LTTSQIQYCLAEDIRLGAAKSVVNAYVDAEVDHFNEMVNDYNVRCGEYRYREGTLESARYEVERHRSALEAEGRSRMHSSVGGASVVPGPAEGGAEVDWEAVLAKYAREQPQPAREPNPEVQAIHNESGAARKPDLTAASSWEQAAIERACSYDKNYRGPGDYYECLRRELNDLSRYSGKPDLSAVSSSERAAIERACSYDKSYRGPGDYYGCLRRELAQVSRFSGRPDLSGASASEQAAIERACSYDKSYRGPAAYYECLRRELSDLSRFTGKPDLSRASASERAAIERACSYDKSYRGPAAYYACLARELAEAGYR
jgi:hypothetical protein